MKVSDTWTIETDGDKAYSGLANKRGNYVTWYEEAVFSNLAYKTRVKLIARDAQLLIRHDRASSIKVDLSSTLFKLRGSR